MTRAWAVWSKAHMLRLGRRGQGAAILGITALWLCGTLLVNPTGDFPLNDDWSYGRAVLHLLDEGRLRLTGWTSMPLLAQVLWGALFCLPSGFSFTALRVSTLVLGLIGILGTYGLLREARTANSLAVVGALVVAVNPIYLNLSHTFMTDVSFFGLTTVSLLLLIRGVRHDRASEIALGSLLACAATLVRQLGVVIPLSFAVAYLVKNGTRKQMLSIALLPSVLALAALLGYRLWLRSTLALPMLYDYSQDRLLGSLREPGPTLLAHLTMRMGITVLYVGLFLLPFLASQAVARRPSLPGSVLGVGTLGVGIAGFIWKKRLMPLWGNILYDIGSGPPTLRDTFILSMPHLPTGPRPLWIAVTAASLIGAVLLTARATDAVRLCLRQHRDNMPCERWLLCLALSGCALYFLPLGICGGFDRYILPLLPLAMIGLAASMSPGRRRSPRSGLIVASVLLAAYAIFSVAATHDYLSWNRARWQALCDLTQRAGIRHQRIDGGFEFNGWYGYDPDYHRDPRRSWWWVDDDEYVIAFGPIAGYSEIDRYQYDRWMPRGRGSILVLQRDAEPAITGTGLDSSTQCLPPITQQPHPVGAAEDVQYAPVAGADSVQG
ncbi:MAG TPA: glycosyltransferase family 39 protein [Anaerolineae bacterium]|nr:glycosyltransferase family 39 protein [Anaerolineae bacterium]